MNITRPTLLLDENKCRRNISNMVQKASRHHVNFRPHFKTHQSAEIGSWFKESGVTGIAVSSVQMASYFATAGWDDILIAFPANILEIEEINALARKIKLFLLLESFETTKFLIENLKYTVGIYLKIDTGYYRTGLAPADERIREIIGLIMRAPNLNFTGFLTHAGHAYFASGKSQILEIHQNSIKQLLEAKQTFSGLYGDCILSIGDTPTCSLATDFKGIDEIRPGNFVFYDAMQYLLGSCHADQISVALVCPVVARHKSRSEIIVYGGGIHFSKESVLDKKGRRIFGLIVNLREKDWSAPLSDTYVSALSQEHGTIKTTSHLFEHFYIGQVIGILPVHSCLAANLMSHYTTLENKKISKFSYQS